MTREFGKSCPTQAYVIIAKTDRLPTLPTCRPRAPSRLIGPQTSLILTSSTWPQRSIHIHATCMHHVDVWFLAMAARISLREVDDLKKMSAKMSTLWHLWLRFYISCHPIKILHNLSSYTKSAMLRPVLQLNNSLSTRSSSLVTVRLLRQHVNAKKSYTSLWREENETTISRRLSMQNLRFTIRRYLGVQNNALIN